MNKVVNHRVNMILEYFRIGEYTFNTALYLLEPFMQTSEAQKLLQAVKVLSY